MKCPGGFMSTFFFIFLSMLSSCLVLFSSKRHEDITQRMPREEAAEIEAFVTKVAQSICPGVICQASPRRRVGRSGPNPRLSFRAPRRGQDASGAGLASQRRRPRFTG